MRLQDSEKNVLKKGKNFCIFKKAPIFVVTNNIVNKAAKPTVPADLAFF
jgi:hypothetical protein